MSDVLGAVRYSEEQGAYLTTTVAVKDDIAPQTRRLIDCEVKRIIEIAQMRVCDLLTKHRAVLDEAARILQEEEVITGGRLAKIAERT